ncbi:MAG: RNA methyltransferase [Patescibacteria group bacterium]
MSKKTVETILVLPDIRSAHNVGSIFRTADAAGVSQIVLCGYTPRPIDRFGRTQKEIAKTALGGEKTIPWVYEKSITKAIGQLKKEGFVIVAIEQSDDSIDYKKMKTPKKIALVVGNEVKGLPKRILSLCDTIIEIPMSGKKESLNVGVAAGVVLFRVLKI